MSKLIIMRPPRPDARPTPFRDNASVCLSDGRRGVVAGVAPISAYPSFEYRIALDNGYMAKAVHEDLTPGNRVKPVIAYGLVPPAPVPPPVPIVVFVVARRQENRCLDCGEPCEDRERCYRCLGKELTGEGATSLSKSVKKLEERHGDYFNMERVHRLVPMDSIVSSKHLTTPAEECASRVDRAHAHMLGAAAGQNAKRDPISVSRRGDKFHVEDGNSTFGAAKRAGWRNMPVRIVKANLSKSLVIPPVHHTPAVQSVAQARPTMFTHEETHLPHGHEVRQPVSDTSTLLAHAARHKDWMDHIIDRGQGLSHKMGLHVVENRELTPQDIKEGHRRGGLVHLAPVKGAKRTHEKVDTKYAGDASRLRDLSRATIAVSHADDIAHVTHHLRQSGMAFGARPDDHFANPTPVGYKDIALAPKDQHGHIGELQINTLDHLQAKQHGFGGRFAKSGHEMYEHMRSMPVHGEFTPEQQSHLKTIQDNSRALYAEADRRAALRSPKLHTKLAKSVSLGGSMHKVNVGKETHYYMHEGVPAKRAGASGRPRILRGQRWSWLPMCDLMHFDHHAHTVSAHEWRSAVARCVAAHRPKSRHKK